MTRPTMIFTLDGTASCAAGNYHAGRLRKRRLNQASIDWSATMAAIALRWSAWLLVAGAALLGAAIVRVSFSPVMNQTFPPGVSVLMLVSSIFLVLSLPAMYAWQADSAGWLGLAGFVLLQVEVLFLVIISAAPLVYPSITTPPGESIVALSRLRTEAASRTGRA